MGGLTSLECVHGKASCLGCLSALPPQPLESELEQSEVLGFAVIGVVTLSQVTEPFLASLSFEKWDNNSKPANRALLKIK